MRDCIYASMQHGNRRKVLSAENISRIESDLYIDYLGLFRCAVLYKFFSTLFILHPRFPKIGGNEIHTGHIGNAGVSADAAVNAPNARRNVAAFMYKTTYDATIMNGKKFRTRAQANRGKRTAEEILACCLVTGAICPGAAHCRKRICFGFVALIVKKVEKHLYGCERLYPLRNNKDLYARGMSLAWERAGEHVKKIGAQMRKAARAGNAVGDTDMQIDDVWTRWARGEFNGPDGDALVKQLARAMESRVLWAAADIYRSDKAFRNPSTVWYGPHGKKKTKEQKLEEQRELEAAFAKLQEEERESVDDITPSLSFSLAGKGARRKGGRMRGIHFHAPLTIAVNC